MSGSIVGNKGPVPPADSHSSTHLRSRAAADTRRRVSLHGVNKTDLAVILNLTGAEASSQMNHINYSPGGGGGGDGGALIVPDEQVNE